MEDNATPIATPQVAPVTPPATPPATPTVSDTVPYTRFQEVVKERKALESQIAELSGKAQTAEALQAQIASLTTQIARQNVAAEAGLPAELMPYIQGTTAEEMAASAKFLATRLAASTPVAPNIDATTKTDTLPTFTLSQLMDAKFFRDNEAAIMQAQRDGRIVKG